MNTTTTLPPLKLKCSRTDCPNDLHFFGKKPRSHNAAAFGPCIECKQDLIDWTQVHARDLKNVRDTFAQLQREWIRHHYWHNEIDRRAINRALRKGRDVLRNRVRAYLEKKVGSANPNYDGRQTGWGGTEPTTYAQHATASCCRKCIAEWHGIPQGQPLTSQDLDYLTELAMLFFEERISGLTDEAQRIPPIRKDHNDAD